MISINEILKLSIAERLSLLEKIWSSIPSENITLSESQKKELDSRIERVEDGQAKYLTWDEVKKQLHKK